MTTDTLTTHFEYHAIDANLLKLDILGHDDPTMIRRLEKLTGTNAVEIPFDDPKLMSLFESPEALGVTSERKSSNSYIPFRRGQACKESTQSRI